MATARLSLRRIESLQFYKLCGSGTGQGFTPVPNTAVWAILTVWPDQATAEAELERVQVFRNWRNRADENWTIHLQTTSARGTWAGQAPFSPKAAHADGPLAALTRATIKPRILPKFWGRVPDISNVIGDDPNVIFKIGIGELPWLHQVTFSIWPNTETMAQFARRDGPHARAISAVRDGDWFKEELYARFNIIGDAGSWGGSSPLPLHERSTQ